MTKLAALVAVSLFAGVACTESPSSTQGDAATGDAGVREAAVGGDARQPATFPPACGPDNCEGCCQDGYRCLRGSAQEHCGSAGAQCRLCAAPDSCIEGHCQPGAMERCNDVDDDGDGDVDEGCDDDLDRYCDATMEVVGSPAVCVKGGGDCDDERPGVHPEAVERCNALDDNCDDSLDEQACQAAPTVALGVPAHLPAVMRDHACVVADKKVHCLGGQTHVQSYSNRVVVFDPDADAIRVGKARIPAARKELACAAVEQQGPVYCFGGYAQDKDESRVFKDVFAYSPGADAVYTVAAELRRGLRGLSCAYDGQTKKIYCFGGETADEDLSNEILAFDPASETLQLQQAQLPSGRRLLSCVASAKAIYCFGGEDQTGKLSSILRYAPATDMLTELPDGLPRATTRLSCVETVADQQVACVGGRVEEGAAPMSFDEMIPDVVLFAVTDNSVTLAAQELFAPRESLSCVRVATRDAVYCLGGARHEVGSDDIVRLQR